MNDTGKAKSNYTPRFVIWNPNRGVYLGGNVWSREPDATTKAAAPTYEGTENLSGFPPKTTFVEAIPDLPGQHCSKLSLSNSSIETW